MITSTWGPSSEPWEGWKKRQRRPFSPPESADMGGLRGRFHVWFR